MIIHSATLEFTIGPFSCQAKKNKKTHTIDGIFSSFKSRRQNKAGVFRPLRIAVWPSGEPG
jgi:hypothetical protein